MNLQEDLFGGCCGFLINGTVYNIGAMDSEWDQQYNGILHESGHLFRFNHSRTLSQQTNQDDYGDQWDVMSCLGCFGTTTTFGRNNDTGARAGCQRRPDGHRRVGGGRPQADRLRQRSSCNQRTVQLAALNHPEASGYLDAQIPASIFIQKIGTSTTTDHYSLELREKSGWDAGIPQHAVLVHLHGQDNYSYLVDQSGLAGTYYTANFSNDMAAGDAYVDAPRKAYVAVNSISGATHQATLTIGACKIDTRQRGRPRERRLRRHRDADRRPQGQRQQRPDPRPDRRADAGHAELQRPDGHGRARHVPDHAEPALRLLHADRVLRDGPGVQQLERFGGLHDQQGGHPARLHGATTSDYHDAFTASAKLTEPDGPVAGKTVKFELGTGDTCSATTNGTGDASCSIVPRQAAGASTIKASFVRRRRLQAEQRQQAVHDHARADDDGLHRPDRRPAGRLGRDAQGPAARGRRHADRRADLTLKVGSQSCTGTTASDGVATCKVTFTGALGSASLSAAFAGDAFYLPSSDTAKTATVFSFPSRGAFVLGDRTVATATAATTVTWWADTWAGLNSLTGGGAPSSFKGFAGTAPLPTSTPPAACGGNWTTGPGASPPPTSGVPSYMGVLVAGSVTKSGSTIFGNTRKIVVVKVRPRLRAHDQREGDRQDRRHVLLARLRLGRRLLAPARGEPPGEQRAAEHDRDRQEEDERRGA